MFDCIFFFECIFGKMIVNSGLEILKITVCLFDATPY